MTQPRVLLFDLGGVVVRWTGIAALSQMTNLPREDVLARFAASKTFYPYETGHCSDDAFAQDMIETFALPMSAGDFKEIWCSWVGETYDGVEEALLALRGNFVTACLSNTNNLHWRHLERYFDFESFFDESFASHQIGCAKPAPASFQHVIDTLGERPQDILFFDDTAVNVAAAKALGMSAELIDPAHGVMPALYRLGLIAR